MGSRTFINTITSKAISSSLDVLILTLVGVLFFLQGQLCASNGIVLPPMFIFVVVIQAFMLLLKYRITSTLADGLKIEARTAGCLAHFECWAYLNAGSGMILAFIVIILTLYVSWLKQIISE